MAGDALLHLDVRSDNLCLLPDRVVLVDWNHAVRGNPAVDLAFWAPSLRLEGGPAPEALVGDPSLAALVAGFFAAHAGLPEIPHAPRVR
ncbi:MAG: phosphotransferase [Myxococcota bacterium]